MDEHRADRFVAAHQGHSDRHDGALAEIVLKSVLKDHRLSAFEHGAQVFLRIFRGQIGRGFIQPGYVQAQAVFIEQPDRRIGRRVVDALGKYARGYLKIIEIFVVFGNLLRLLLHVLQPALELIEPHEARDQRPQHQQHDHQHRHEVDGHAQQQLVKHYFTSNLYPTLQTVLICQPYSSEPGSFSRMRLM